MLDVAAAAYRHLYVHVPFCARRCSYCDFSIAVRRDVPVAEYVTSVGAELAIRGLRHSRPTLDTLYLGGGTPSRLGSDGIGALLDTIREVADLAPGAEVTMEANPEDITVDTVRRWKGHGVTRLSIGVQSFDDRVLQWMHRVHDGAAAETAVHAARDGGIEEFSLDLIFALPQGIERNWEQDVGRALALAPGHVSLYGLTIEDGTPLGRWRERGDVTESPEERYEVEFLHAHRVLSDAGFEHYEVSNFAQPGCRARHNSAYWTGAPYLGVGPSAHGFDGISRAWNLKHYAEWVRALDRGVLPVGGHERLTDENRAAETVYLGLRTSDGLDVTTSEVAVLQSWIRAGWLVEQKTMSHQRVLCTAEGWLRLDALAADLTARRSHS
ncbi:MAG TPA: radical SAM family heme chaperone HemW [Gemmatimonas sp.]|nr:radical SAM family heme chaperone HemW [Gemmatimonas sp.]